MSTADQVHTSRRGIRLAVTGTLLVALGAVLLAVFHLLSGLLVLGLGVVVQFCGAAVRRWDVLRAVAGLGPGAGPVVTGPSLSPASWQRRGRWAFAVAAALVLGTAVVTWAVPAGPDRILAAFATALLASLTLIAGLAVAVTVRAGRRVRRMIELRAPDGRGWPCVDPRDPETVHALVLDGVGVRVLDTAGFAVQAWMWRDVERVGAGLVQVRLAALDGVRIRLVSGIEVPLAVTGDAGGRAPAGRAAEVVGAIQDALARPATPSAVAEGPQHRGSSEFRSIDAAVVPGRGELYLLVPLSGLPVLFLYLAVLWTVRDGAATPSVIGFYALGTIFAVVVGVLGVQTVRVRRRAARGQLRGAGERDPG